MLSALARAYSGVGAEPPVGPRVKDPGHSEADDNFNI